MNRRGVDRPGVDRPGVDRPGVDRPVVDPPVGDPPVASRLELRYRRLLRLLPAWYRERRGDEMLGTFLADRDDELDLEFGWPGWGEAWAVVVLAARTRLAAPGGPPRAAALGGAVRLVAVLGLVAHAAMATAGLVRAGLGVLAGHGLPSGWLEPLAVTTVAVGAAVTLTADRRGPAKGLALAGLGYVLFHLVRRLAEHGGAWPLALADLPLLVTTGCLLAGFHREAPAPSRSWLWAAAAAVGAAVAWTVLVVAPLVREWPTVVAGQPWGPLVLEPWQQVLLAVDPSVLPAVAVVVAGAVVMARARAATTVALALAVAAAALLPERAYLLRTYPQPDAAGQVGLGVTAGLTVGLAATVVVMAVLAGRGVRRLPNADRSGVVA